MDIRKKQRVVVEALEDIGLALRSDDPGGDGPVEAV